MKKSFFPAVIFSCFLAVAGVLAETGDPDASIESEEAGGATISTRSDDVAKILKRAENGDAGAQYELGQMYDDGFDLPQDYQEALKWYKRAAEHGNVNAQYRLGGMYYWGQGVTKNDQAAYTWFKAAAEQGDVYAQFNLGLMCRKGKGTARNYVDAWKWFCLAADSNDEDASAALSSLESEMTPEQLEQARQMVEDWYRAHQ